MNSKRKLAAVLALVAVVTCFGAVSASALAAPGPDVRVNGALVAFPDAGPFLDGSGRTLIPVRFVAENLGAQVTWDGKTATAFIEKDGVTVAVTIGDSVLKVTKDGRTETVAMDTAAVLKDGRTCVPIRFVAEALGAYVDWSDTCRTVGIWSDLLTPEQISALQALPYTRPDSAFGYEAAKEKYDAETLAYLYGTDRERFGTFANAREHLYHMKDTYGADTFYADVVAKARECVGYSSDRLTVRFLTDTSCVYQPDGMDRLTCAVRGYAEAELKVQAKELTAAETVLLCRLGFGRVTPGTQTVAVDVHMNARAGREITVHTIVPAGGRS